MEGKKVLIIDDEMDFCLLMEFYLGKKNCTVDYALNINDGLDLIEMKRPEIIIVDSNLAHGIEDILNNKISSMDNYAPSISSINSNSPTKESIINDEAISPDGGGILLDEIKKWIQSIINRFKK